MKIVTTEYIIDCSHNDVGGKSETLRLSVKARISSYTNGVESIGRANCSLQIAACSLEFSQAPMYIMNRIRSAYTNDLDKLHESGIFLRAGLCEDKTSVPRSTSPAPNFRLDQRTFWAGSDRGFASQFAAREPYLRPASPFLMTLKMQAC